MSTHSIKNINTKLEDLEKKVEQRPTYTATVTILGIAAGAAITLFTFITGWLLNNQAAKINAETKVVITECVQAHEQREEAKWEDRKEDLVKTVLARLGMR